jgi:hypothetical protein
MGEIPETDQLGNLMAYAMRPMAQKTTPMGVPPVQIAPPAPMKTADPRKIIAQQLLHPVKLT